MEKSVAVFLHANFKSLFLLLKSYIKKEQERFSYLQIAPLENPVGIWQHLWDVTKMIGGCPSVYVET